MPNLIPQKQFLGMNTRLAVTKANPNSAFVARNIKIDASGIQPIKGFKKFGAVASADGEKIRDAYTFTLQDGTEIPVRVRDDKTNNVVEWYDATNKTWYTLLKQTTGLTTVFQDYNSSTANQLIWGNGSDNYTIWTGNATRLTSAVTATDTTINVVSTDGFPATGTITYNGTEIAYTGKAATTFTVGSAHASAGADDGVAESPDDSTYSGVVKGDVMISAFNRMWIVNTELRRNQLEYSKEGDALDFTAGNNRADAGVEDFPIVGGGITGLSAKDQYALIFKRNTIIAFQFQYPTSTTKTPDFKHLTISKDIGAINHKGIATAYDEIIYATKNGIRSLSKLPNSSEDFNSDPISNEILTTIKDYDFSEASSIYYDKEDVYLCSVKTNSDQTNNNKTIAIWFYNDEFGNRRRAFTLLDIGADSWFVYQGNLYFGSSAEGTTYQLFTGNSFGGATFIAQYITNRNDYGAKKIKDSEFYIIEGLIATGTDINLEFIYDGGRSGVQKATIESSGGYVSSQLLNTMGAFKLGEEVLGGTIEEVASLKPFRVIVELQLKNFFDLQVSYKGKGSAPNFLIYYGALVNTEIPNEFSPDI